MHRLITIINLTVAKKLASDGFRKSSLLGLVFVLAMTMMIFSVPLSNAAPTPTGDYLTLTPSIEYNYTTAVETT